jgi:hypothetical protein
MEIKEQRDYVLKLPQEIKNSLIWYTGGSYAEFSTSLREGKIPKEEKHYKNMLLAFQGVPPLHHPLTVYKGIKHTQKVMDIDKAFSSTSLNFSGTEDFRGSSCCVLQITVPPGSKIIPLFDISHVQSEAEILLDKNGRYNVSGEDIRQHIDKYKLTLDMKIFYVSYIPEVSVSVDKLSQVVKKAEPVLDSNLIQERIIKYIKGKDISEEDLSDEIILVGKRLGIELPDKVLQAILLRLKN